MTYFDDLYNWVDNPEGGKHHFVHAALAVVYDKSNPEESAAASPDFSAAGEGIFELEDGELTASFLMTFSDRVRPSGGGGWSAGRRNVWRVRLARDGTAQLFQTGWMRDWAELDNVQRADDGRGDFAVGHLRRGSTRALLSLSFDRLAAEPLI